MIPTSIDGTDITGATIDGTDVTEITVDGDTVFTAVQPIDVYLEDDFGDNALTNRTGSTTGTYNGVSGTFRPEYTSELSSFPNVNNGTLEVDGGESINADLELDLSQTITWEFVNVDIASMGSNFGDSSINLFSSQKTNRRSTASLLYELEAYQLTINESGVFELLYIDSSSNTTTVVQGSTSSTVFDLKVTRSPGGTWELFINNNSQGTATNTDNTNPQFFGITTRDNTKSFVKLDSYKIF